MFELNAAQQRRRLALVLGISLAAPVVNADSQDNYLSDRYSINQTFGGRAYRKDNNIWVVSPAFAEKFGMPDNFIDAKLKGIEAAAFRIEKTAYEMCGFGGKDDNCAAQDRCLLDIYVDESKTPLPWASADRADWISDYNSIHFLRTPTEKGIRPRYLGEVQPNTVVKDFFTLHPFADPESKLEANYYTNAYIPYSERVQFSSFRVVFGYSRNAIAGLSVVSMGFGCLARNSEKREISFRLDSRKTVGGDTMKSFHEFKLPESFVRRIDDRVEDFKKNKSKNLLDFVK